MPPKSMKTDDMKPVKVSTGKVPSKWMTHVKKVHTAGKKKDATYQYKDAMRDAKATYKK